MCAGGGEQLGEREEALCVAAMRWIEGGEETLPKELGELLWETLRAHQGEEFRTAKNLAFSYGIRGNEMFVSRKDKSITRATATLAFCRALELKRARLPITGPKKLGTFGASYLYPIFQRIGLIETAQGK